MSIGVAVHFLGDIHRIMDGALAVDDGVVTINGVAKNKGVMGVGSGTSHTSSTSSGGGIKAFATREGKECHSHNQCQGESQ